MQEQQAGALAVEVHTGRSLLQELDRLVATQVGRQPGVSNWLEVGDIAQVDHMAVGNLLEGLAGTLVGNIVAVDQVGMQALFVHMVVPVLLVVHMVVDTQVVPSAEGRLAKPVGRSAEAGDIDCHKGSILD